MSSINTNLSAMTALQSLKSTQNAMNKTQNQISSGLRVGEASHNASYWSIATQMKSDNGALGAVKDAIGQSKAMINTFNSALDKTLTYLNKMKEGLVAASQPGADLAAIQTEMKTNIEGLQNTAKTAEFNGQNWLQTDADEVSLVTSFNKGAVEKQTITLTDAKLFAADGSGGILDDATDGSVIDINLSTADPTDPADTVVSDALAAVDAAIEKVRTGSALLGANKALLETQEEFIGVLSDSLTAGVSSFIDADMNEASTRYQALQTQQQLGVQALSMANQNSQMILKLFQ